MLLDTTHIQVQDSQTLEFLNIGYTGPDLFWTRLQGDSHNLSIHDYMM